MTDGGPLFSAYELKLLDEIKQIEAGQQALIEALTAMVGQFEHWEHDGCECNECAIIRRARAALHSASKQGA